MQRIIRILISVPLALSWMAAGAVLAAPLPVHTVHIKSVTKHNMVDVSYPTTGMAAIDGEIAAKIAELRKEAAHDPADTYTAQYWLDVRSTVLRNDSQMFVVHMSIDTFTGGAHANHTIETYNYLMPDGYRVALPDIVGHNGMARVSKFAIADLNRQNKAQDFTDADWIARGAGPDPDNFDAFAWLPGKLELYFPEYQVASYASGEQRATIPLAALTSVVRADWRAPEASFACATAKSKIEMAICADAALARLDRQLAGAYRLRHESAEDDAAKAKLQAGQRSWLAARDRLCTKDAQPAMIACLTGLYRQRVAVLSTWP